MTTPTQPVQAMPQIQSVSAVNGLYEATLADSTVLWIPVDNNNSDYLHLQDWARANNITL